MKSYDKSHDRTQNWLAVLWIAVMDPFLWMLLVGLVMGKSVPEVTLPWILILAACSILVWLLNVPLIMKCPWRMICLMGVLARFTWGLLCPFFLLPILVTFYVSIPQGIVTAILIKLILERESV